MPTGQGEFAGRRVLVTQAGDYMGPPITQRFQEEGAEALLEAVNASLAKLQDDGTYDEIFNKWFSA